jgi:hypothetical protein
MQLLEKIEKDTLKLKLDEKYYLIEKLLESVDNYSDKHSEDEWEQIVNERTVELENKSAQTISSKEVMKKLKNKL